MKRINKLIIPVLLVTTLTSFLSCGVDRWTEYAAETEFDQWITNTMRENYLWYADIPADKSLNPFLAPDAFFKTVLSSQDKSSYIDTLRQSPPPSYGFDYSLRRVLNNDTAYHALITYILPSSPAAKAGLQRGEWIMQVNDELITKKSESRLLESGKALKLTLGKYTMQKDEETQTDIGVVVETGTTEMGAKAEVEDNPVHFSKVITTPQKGIKVGYLVYTHFTAGPTADSQLYNDQLRAISREFADAGVTQFILDLRYNTGGSLACAQLISTLLAPAEALNTPFAHVEYNDKLTAKNHTLLYDRSLIGSGANLNIQLGLILTSSAITGTTGVLLNCLSPLGRWGIIGSSVGCQGIATEAFIHPEYPWSINPVVCTVFNTNDESNRNMSFQPTLAVDETTNLLKFLPFGDENEALLSTAIGVMDGTTPLPDQLKTQSNSTKNVIHTPSRKAPGRTTIH